MSFDRDRPMAVDSLEKVRIQGVDQWVLVRSADERNPVLLLLQQGPGLPMINEAEAFDRATRLEDSFTVVYWDYRGCGKSYDPSTPAESITLEQYVRDTTEMSELLLARFGKTRLTMLGLSMGGTIAILAGVAHPAYYDAIVAVAPDLAGADAEAFAYDFALAEARKRKNRCAESALDAIGPPPHATVEAFGTRVKWIANFGGVRRGATYNRLLSEAVVRILRSRHYSLGDVFRTMRGMELTQKLLVREMPSWDLRARVDPASIPLHVFQGRFDKAANPAIAAAFTPHLVWFEHSAHAPHYEESEKFRTELLRAHRSRTAHAGARTS
jgi:pimeloyl-ACP methyl ester carboxylesterase